MPSIRTTIFATATTLLSAAHADYVIDPSTVSLSLRNTWCQQEMSSCPLICEQYKPGGTEINDCDPETLTYGCLCENGLQPNVSEYSLTIPYFTCTEWGNQCVTRCDGDARCASSCREDHPCGALNPTRANKTKSKDDDDDDDKADDTKDGDSDDDDDPDKVFNGLDGASDDSPQSAAVRALHNGSLGGFLILAAGVFAGVGIML